MAVVAGKRWINGEKEGRGRRGDVFKVEII
jgi:hypothetical protein